MIYVYTWCSVLGDAINSLVSLCLIHYINAQSSVPFLNSEHHYPVSCNAGHDTCLLDFQ